MVGVAERPTGNGILGSRLGELVLRVCGGPRDGQVVRLSSTKCAIGSAENCTLRLRAAGVRPVHCLILRGAKRTVIRSWSHDTRLNGRAFDDALLISGDRISIGPIEFDVVTVDEENRGSGPHECSRTACSTIEPLAPSDNAELFVERGRAELARLRQELDAERADFERRVREQIDTLEARRTAWENQQVAAQRQNETERQQQLASFEARELELQRREERIAQQAVSRQDEQVACDARREERERELADIQAQRQAFDAQSHELAAQQALARDFQTRLEQERAELQTRLEELEGRGSLLASRDAEVEQARLEIEAIRNELETNRAELAAARGRLEAERADLEAHRAAFAIQAGELEQHQQRLIDEQASEGLSTAEADQQRVALEAECARLTNEITSLTERLAVAEQATAAAQTATETECERDQREIQLAELQRALDEQSQQLEFDQAALQTERQQWSIERDGEMARLREDQSQAQSLESRLRAEREQLDDARRELEEERQAVEVLRQVMNKPEEAARATAPPVSVSDLLREKPSSHDTSSDASLAEHEGIGFTPLKTEAPLATSDLFRRLGITTDEEDGDTADTSASHSHGGERSRHVTRPELPPVVPQAGHAADADHEESIEDYMQKLLQRTRRAGDAPASQASFAPTPPVAETRPKVTPQPAASTLDSAEPSEPASVVRQRSAAPRESAADRNDLRELANLSARGAIAAFERSKHRKALVGSSTLAFCTIALSLGLLFIGRHEPLLIYCGVAGLVVGFFSIVRALVSTRRLRKARAKQTQAEARRESLLEETEPAAVAASNTDAAPLAGE